MLDGMRFAYYEASELARVVRLSRSAYDFAVFVDL